MKRLFFTLLAIILLTSVSMAQLGYIPLNVDYSTFKGADGKTYTEIYVSFFQQDLDYSEEDSSFYAKFSHTVSVTQNDSIYYNITRNYKSGTVNKTFNLTNQFIDVFPVDLDPGNFSLNVNVVDKNSNKTGEYSLDLIIPEFTESPVLSKIQLATNIDSKGEKSNFSLKNNVTIYPNASKTYTIINPIMYFYFEGYKLALNANGNSSYSYNYYVTDMDGKKLKDYPAKNKSGTSKTIAEANGINVIALPSGPYFLSVELKDLISHETCLTRKKFFINKPKRQSSSAAVSARIDGYEEYVDFSRDQLIDEFNKIKYIAMAEEVDIFEKLENDEGMKRFLSQFWKRRDPQPETPVNEYKQKYFESIRIADANYTTHFKEGWRSDRGRVILIYGRPDEIDRTSSVVNSQPYEIWLYYSLEGGAQFVFADINGNGNYELLHSTYRNEIKDPNWKSRIQKLRTRDNTSGFDF